MHDIAAQIGRIAGGDRSAWPGAHAALVQSWEADADVFDDAVDSLAAAASQRIDLALELLLTIMHELGLARPAILRLTVDADQVEEAAQATLVAVERGIGSFEGKARFRTWLFTVARNQAITVLRRSSRQPEATAWEDDGSLAAELPQTRFSSVVASRKTVEEAVDSLPDHYRDVLLLRVQSQLEYQEIADQLDVPIGTVRSRISKARQILMETLSGHSVDRPGVP